MAEVSLTPQRQRVLDLFERTGAGHHLSAEDVHQQLLRGDCSSLATVCRTLRLLTTMDLLRQLELPEAANVLSWPPMMTMIITTSFVACGRTEEFESEAVLGRRCR